MEGKEDREGEDEVREDEEKEKHHEDHLDFANFVKLLKGKQEVTERHVEGEGEPEPEEEEKDSEEGGEGEEDELEEEEEEEEKRYEDRVKGEVYKKVIYKPRKGINLNKQPCDTCVKRGKVCHMQDSIKAEACYECAILKTRCIFTVSFLYF